MSARRSTGRGGRRAATAAPVSSPDAFRERMAEMLGEEVDRFLEALAEPAAGLRVNTLRVDSARFQALAPFDLTPLPFPPDGFLVDPAARPGAHPYHAAGLYYLQDPGAMVVAALPELSGEPHVLDLAAAPGGKSTHLAARMQGRGILVANDVHAGRAWELAGNLERCGVRNALVTSESPARLAAAWPQWFDVVLVDAPCSGESMFHKSDAARREWSVESVAGCARRQRELLADAVRLVKPGGVLIYSTCTFAPEENEQVLASLLDEHPELAVVTLPRLPGSESARPEWGGPNADLRIGGALRLWPHHFPGAGHFVAALQRVGAGSDPVAPSSAPSGQNGPVAPEAESQRLLEAFVSEVVPGLSLRPDDIVARGDELFLRPQAAPPLAGVRLLRPGWWLGTVRKGRFEPSHSLAMGVAPAEAAMGLELEASSAAVNAYLGGEVLRAEGPDGWVLVSVDGFPLGWGKRSSGVVKNHYPKGLRRR